MCFKNHISNAYPYTRILGKLFKRTRLLFSFRTTFAKLFTIILYTSNHTHTHISNIVVRIGCTLRDVFLGGSTKIVYNVKRPYRGHVAVHSLQPTVSEEDQFTYSMITKMAKRERQSSVKTKVVDLFCVVCLHKIFNAFNVVLKLTLNFWIPASKERSTSINYFSFF